MYPIHARKDYGRGPLRPRVALYRGDARDDLALAGISLAHQRGEEHRDSQAAERGERAQ